MPSSFISWTCPLPIISRGDIPTNTTLRRTYPQNPMQCCCRPWLELVLMTGRGGQEWWDVRVNAVVVHQLDLPPPHHLTRRHTNKYHTTTSHLPPRPDAMLWVPAAFAGVDERERRTRVVGRESQCRRRSSAGPASSQYYTTSHLPPRPDAMLNIPKARAGGDDRETRTRVVGRERQCRRRSSAGPAPSPSSHEATYQQIPHYVALTANARCNALKPRGLSWWR